MILLTSLTFSVSCTKEEIRYIQPQAFNAVDIQETEGPVTHGGEEERTRARLLKAYYEGYESVGDENVKNHSLAYWSMLKLVYKYPSILRIPQSLIPVLEKLFEGDAIFEEIEKSKIHVKVFAPYNFTGTQEEKEREFGSCFREIPGRKKQAMPSTTKEDHFAEVCIDAKMSSKTGPTNAEKVALFSGHELLHHFNYGFDDEDTVIAMMQDFVARTYDRIAEVAGGRAYDAISRSNVLRVSSNDLIEFRWENFNHDINLKLFDEIKAFSDYDKKTKDLVCSTDKSKCEAGYIANRHTFSLSEDLFNMEIDVDFKVPLFYNLETGSLGGALDLSKIKNDVYFIFGMFIKERDDHMGNSFLFQGDTVAIYKNGVKQISLDYRNGNYLEHETDLILVIED